MNWAGAQAEERIPPAGQGFATREALLADLRQRLIAGEGFAVATLNLDHANKLKRLPEFRKAYVEHTHITADGNPIVWLERLAGNTAELVPGSDLVEPVARLATDLKAQLAFVGTTEATLNKAVENLTLRLPELDAALLASPEFGFDPLAPQAEELVASVEDSGARVCFLALGAPKQEIFAARLRRAMPDLGIVSVGAGLDFLAGTQRRAPEVVRAVALEWLWRAAGDPRRLAGRYARCAAMIPGLTIQALRNRAEQAPQTGKLAP